MYFSTAPQSQRQFATIAMIALAHVVLLAAILANPIARFTTAPKQTIVMMVPTAQPPAQVRPAQKTEKLSKQENIVTTQLPAAVITKADNPDAIQVAPAISEVPPAPNHTPVSAAPSVAKAEPSGPKVISAVEYIQAPQADYPPMAKRMGEEGRVVMQVLVNDKGRAEKVEIIKSSGFNRLDESARTALMRAIFKPYVEDGKSVTVLATASINFSLRG